MYFISGCEEDIELGVVTIKSVLYDSLIELTEKKYIEEYEELKENGCRCLDSELKKILNKQGVLLSEDDVGAVLSEMDDYFKDCLLLVIMPTEACNFRCIYCYENHENKTMSVDTVQAIKKFLLKNITKYKQISIGWFGGEPTLCKDIVLNINEVARKITNYDKELYTFTMTTNGFLLDIKTFLEYYNSGINSYQITIDGWKHDENRPLVNGGKTFQTIIDNLDAIQKLPEQYDFCITIRHNILADDNDFSWYDFLDKKYGDDNRFCILVCTVNEMGNDEVKKLNLIVGTEKQNAVKKHVEYIKKLKIRSENVSKQSLEPGRNMCYASYKNGYVIRADGRLQKCTVFLEHQDNQIGYIDTKGNMHIDSEKNRMWSTLNLSDKCYSCNKVFSCMNKMCPMQRVINGNPECEEYVKL